MSETSYKTVSKIAIAELYEKKSHFIGNIAPVYCEQEAVDFINSIKSQYRDATHNVFAYSVNKEGVLSQRYNDDGEPQGSAGLPVLECIKKTSIQNVVIVITRYFGGILLGVPGLIRAYGKCGGFAIDAAGIITMCLCIPVYINLEYHLLSRVQRDLEGNGYQVLSPEFGATVRLTYIVPEGQVDYMVKRVVDLTNASAQVSFGDKQFFAIG